MAALRADVALVARALFESRAKAQEAIVAGLVAVNGRVLAKASEMIEDGDAVTAQRPYPWVSRGGVKLEAALRAFGLDPAGATCLDVGASTGGFTDVLLAHAAARVYAVDVGHGQIHPRLRRDPRVVSLEGVDSRTLDATLIAPPPNLIVCDVSFISLESALPRPLALASADAKLVALVKPQFEAGRRLIKKGAVKDPMVHKAVCEKIASFLETQGWRRLGLIPSPIRGGDGAAEFLIGAKRQA